jgi:hypothetical protein
MISILSTHVGIKPVGLSETAADLDDMVQLCQDIPGGVYIVNVRSYTKPNGLILAKVLGNSENDVFRRNGVVFASIGSVLDKFKSDPERSYVRHVREFLTKYVAYLNNDLYVVKQIENGVTTSSSDVCYGKAAAFVQAREMDDSAQINWYP